MELSTRQKVMLGGAAAIGAIVFWFRLKTPTIVHSVVEEPHDRIHTLIRSEAAKQGVDPKLALTFADIESKFKSNAIGDTSWYAKLNSKGVTRWDEYVGGDKRYAENPFRNQKHLWASYGLFQLLAPFELWREDANADPRILLDPAINARLGIAKIKRLQDKHGDDPLKIRLAYVGCAYKGCGVSTVLSVSTKFASKAREHGLNIGTDAQVIARAHALASNVPA
jgi:hypothetical protein